MLLKPNMPWASTIGNGPPGGMGASAAASGERTGAPSGAAPVGAWLQPAAITAANASALRTHAIVGTTNFRSIGIRWQTIVPPEVSRARILSNDAGLRPLRGGCMLSGGRPNRRAVRQRG